MKHDFFFWLSNEHACGNFFLQDMYIQQKNLFNDVKMQLKANCMLLFGKKKNKTTASQFSIKMNTQKNECMIC